MASLYKIYVSIKKKRLEGDLERMEIMPQNQTGFRKGMGTIDNIHGLSNIVNRKTETGGEMVVALFVDLKAVFNPVDRRVLWEALEKRGMRKGLRGRIKGVYE